MSHGLVTVPLSDGNSLSCFIFVFVLMQALGGEEGLGAEIVHRHEWIPDSGLKKNSVFACEN